MDENGLDEFVEEHVSRKQERQNKRKNSKNHQRDGGKKIRRVGGNKERWHYDRNANYEEDDLE